MEVLLFMFPQISLTTADFIFKFYTECKFKLLIFYYFRFVFPFLIMTENELSYLIRGAIFKVYNSLGPGLFESVYELALSYELRLLDLDVKTQIPLPVVYNDIVLDGGYRIDIIVNNKVIIEIKSVETLNPVHHKQILTYLKLSKIKLGILINFNSDNIANSIFRKVNGL